MQAWSYVAHRFARFSEALQPTARDEAIVQAASEGVAALIKRRLNASRRTLNGSVTLQPVGGFAKKTALADRRSIDLMLTLPSGGHFAHVDHNRLDGDLAELLSARFGAVQMDSGGWLGIAVPVGNERVTVRVLPAMSAGHGLFRSIGRRRGRSNGAAAIELAPNAECDLIDRTDAATQGKARPLIRLIKSWRNHGNIPLASRAIDVLVAEFFEVWIYRRRGALYFDWMIRDFFFWLGAQGGRTFSDAIGRPMQIGDGFVDACWDAYLIAADAANLERDNSSEAAIRHWRRLFGERVLRAALEVDRQPLEALSPAGRAERPALARMTGIGTGRR